MATFPVLQPSAAATAKPSSGPPPKRTDDYGLLIYDRYTNIFEAVPPSRIPDDSVHIGPDEVLFLIEAPLNSVELYEALLKPAKPFEVHTGRLIPRKARAREARQQLVNEYLTGQGRLAAKGTAAAAAEREVSFIVLPRDTIWQLQMFKSFLWPVQLQYTSLPVRLAGGHKTVRSPYALVCYQAHRVYHKKLKALLRDYKLSKCGFERSLLRPGAAPLPETLREYMSGEPGKDAATPYYRAGPEERPSRLRSVSSTMSLRRAVSRVALRRSQSAASIASHG